MAKTDIIVLIAIFMAVTTGVVAGNMCSYYLVNVLAQF